MKSMWSVLTVYENVRAREAVVAFCQALVQRFWTKFDFDVTSWSFKELESPETFQEKVARAATTDLIVIATERGAAFPLQVRHWLQLWAAARQEKEGILAALHGGREPYDSAAECFLREIAHKAGLNFLTEVPQHIPEPLSESLEVYSERATRVTTVLHSILKPPPPPVARL